MSYNRNKKKYGNKSTGNQHFSITQEGSLGLLAYGDLGLDMWRNVKGIKKNSSNG
jgi:hypothetical protein